MYANINLCMSVYTSKWVNSTSKQCHFLECFNTTDQVGSAISQLGWNVSPPLDLKRGYKAHTWKQCEPLFNKFKDSNPTMTLLTLHNMKNDRLLPRTRRRQAHIFQLTDQIMHHQQINGKYFFVTVSEYSPYFTYLATVLFIA